MQVEKNGMVWACRRNRQRRDPTLNTDLKQSQRTNLVAVFYASPDLVRSLEETRRARSLSGFRFPVSREGPKDEVVEVV